MMTYLTYTDAIKAFITVLFGANQGYINVIARDYDKTDVKARKSLGYIAIGDNNAIAINQLSTILTTNTDVSISTGLMPTRDHNQKSMLPSRSVFIDLDDKTPDEYPTMIVQTSEKSYQTYFILNSYEPWYVIKTLQIAAADYYGLTHDAIDAAHKGRIPATVNTKRGRNNYIASIEIHEDRIYSVAELCSLFGIVYPIVEPISDALIGGYYDFDAAYIDYWNTVLYKRLIEKNSGIPFKWKKTDQKFRNIQLWQGKESYKSNSNEIALLVNSLMKTGHNPEQTLVIMAQSLQGKAKIRRDRYVRFELDISRLIAKNIERGVYNGVTISDNNGIERLKDVKPIVKAEGAKAISTFSQQYAKLMHEHVTVNGIVPLSIVQIADMLKVSTATVSRFEAGQAEYKRTVAKDRRSSWVTILSHTQPAHTVIDNAPYSASQSGIKPYTTCTDSESNSLAHHSQVLSHTQPAQNQEHVWLTYSTDTGKSNDRSWYSEYSQDAPHSFVDEKQDTPDSLVSILEDQTGNDQSQPEILEDKVPCEALKSKSTIQSSLTQYKEMIVAALNKYNHDPKSVYTKIKADVRKIFPNKESKDLIRDINTELTALKKVGIAKAKDTSTFVYTDEMYAIAMRESSLSNK